MPWSLWPISWTRCSGEAESVDPFFPAAKEMCIRDRVETITFRIEENVLYLFVDANYALMDSVREILCRAALTKTLTQIQGIDYLSIYCAEQPIVDGTGNPVGMLSASDFVEGIRDVNSFGKRS